MNQRGFSMIEIMMVLGMVPLVAFAMAFLNQQMSKSSSFTNGSLNMLETHQELQLQMANKAICDSNFSAKVFSNAGIINLDQLVDRDGKKIAYTGQKSEGLQVESIQLRPDPTVWTSYVAAKSTIPASGFAMKVSLIVGFKRAKGAIGSPDASISLPVPMIVGASSNIIGCAGVDTASLDKVLRDSCAQVGGTYDATLGTCVLNTSCNFSDPTKPVSQKCLDQQITILRRQITELQTKTTPLPTPAPENPSIKDCIQTGSVANNAVRLTADSFFCELPGGYTMTLDNRGFIWDSAQKGSKVITDPATLALIKERITKLYNARIASGK